MQKLSHGDLFSLEHYAEVRQDFRAKVMDHKKNRRVPIGLNATLYFEDRLTIQYQIQEMLRVERIFEKQGIEEELGAYNPLIPDATNLKATFMIEFDDEDERRRQLAVMKGIEKCIWLRVGDGEIITPVADEDMERENEEATSAVHFLRFELTTAMISGLNHGTKLSLGIDHSAYSHEVDPVPESIRQSLIEDLVGDGNQITSA